MKRRSTALTGFGYIQNRLFGRINDFFGFNALCIEGGFGNVVRCADQFTQ